MNGESGQTCRVLDFSEIVLCLSPFNVILAISLLNIGFI